jgi:hypothetical protein
MKTIVLSETGRGRPILSDARAGQSREQSKTRKGPGTTAGDTLLERQRNLTDRAPSDYASWLFKEFQISMCPGLLSVRTPEVLP